MLRNARFIFLCYTLPWGRLVLQLVGRALHKMALHPSKQDPLRPRSVQSLWPSLLGATISALWGMCMCFSVEEIWMNLSNIHKLSHFNKFWGVYCVCTVYVYEEISAYSLIIHSNFSIVDQPDHFPSGSPADQPRPKHQFHPIEYFPAGCSAGQPI